MAKPDKAGSAALSIVEHRTSTWLAQLGEELGRRKTEAHEDGCAAASAFIAVLQEVMLVLGDAFERYTSQRDAPEDQRFGWIQILGAQIAVVVTALGKLDGAFSPRRAPLVSAFDRVLQRLVDGRTAVTRPVHFFNYEIEETHASLFAPILGERTDAHKWPTLFLRIPSGLLDSPRNHVLVGHELGHAIAAVRRAEIEKQDRGAKDAKRAGRRSPDPVPPLFTRPAVSPDRIRELARMLWGTLQSPNPAPGDPDSPETEETPPIPEGIIAVTAHRLFLMIDRWMEEVFADAVGFSLFGPAFLQAAIEVMLPSAPFNVADEDHPPFATRLLSLMEMLAGSELGDFQPALPPRIREQSMALAAEAQHALKAGPAGGSDLVTQSTMKVALELVGPVLPRVRESAIDACRELLYTSAQYEADLASHVQTLEKHGVPPIAPSGAPSILLATIFNVASAVDVDTESAFLGAKPRSVKEQDLDDLIRKAIELREFQEAWTAAGETS